MHYQSNAEGDWVYARDADDKSRSGWMPASALQAPKQTRFHAWLKLLFEQSKMANVFETCQNSESDGYLVARIDDQLEVLHYESSAEGDWVYARNAVHQSRLGWMPASALQPPKETWLQLGATVCTTKVLRPAAGRGYLCAGVGGHMQVLYIGGKATEDDGWFYACRLTAL